MKMRALGEELGSTTYPGRGILLGRSADNKKAVIGYFIMGRSINSCNRIFIADGDGIKTKAFDESKMVDPSLVIYNPVLVFEKMQIVTNGDQTDTIFEFLKQGKTFEEALRTRTFEPDPPIFTPRISGIIDSESGAYKLSILKSDNGDESSVQRFFYEYPQPKAGEGHFIHTYDTSMGEDPLLSFGGEPQPVSIPNTIEEFTNVVWESLNDERKVSLFTRYIDLETGKMESRICNKNK